MCILLCYYVIVLLLSLNGETWNGFYGYRFDFLLEFCLCMSMFVRIKREKRKESKEGPLQAKHFELVSSSSDWKRHFNKLKMF